MILPILWDSMATEKCFVWHSRWIHFLFYLFIFIYSHNTQLLPYLFTLIFNPFWILKVHYEFLLGLYKMCCFILFFSVSLLLCLKSISPNDNNNCEIRNYPSWLCFNYSPKQLPLWFHFNMKNIVVLKKLI